MSKLLEKKILHENCITISGKTVKDNVKVAKFLKVQNVVHSVDQ